MVPNAAHTWCRTILVSLVAMSVQVGIAAQQAPPPTAAPAPMPTAAPVVPGNAKSVGLFVYPAKEQTPDVQQKDEGECYASAQQQSGVDPTHPQPAASPVPTAQAPTGGGVKGAAGGAAGGAAIGAIAGDAGEGAAIGATAGAIRGRRAQRKAKKQAEQQAQQQQVAGVQQSLDTFKRAMSACLTARNYSVK